MGAAPAAGGLGVLGQAAQELPDGQHFDAHGLQGSEDVGVTLQVVVTGDERIRFRGEGDGYEEVVAGVAADGDDGRVGNENRPLGKQDNQAVGFIPAKRIASPKPLAGKDVGKLQLNPRRKHYCEVSASNPFDDRPTKSSGT